MPLFLNFKNMKVSKERKKIEANLIVKGDSLSFPVKEYIKVARIIHNMNRTARERREIAPEEVLYSLQRSGAPEGTFFVVRNY